MFFKYFENDNLLKCHRILAALVFFLPSMFFICYISWILQKNLVTLVAWICSLPSMSSHIHLNERFPPSVCFKMSYKIKNQQYCLVTLVTLVWFCHYVSSHGLLNYLSLWNSCHIPLIWTTRRCHLPSLERPGCDWTSRAIQAGIWRRHRSQQRRSTIGVHGK